MLITEIQRFSTKDGPGIRTVVFFKGCPLDCVWCHNPETKRIQNQVYYTERDCILCGSCMECPNNAHSVTDGRHIFDRDVCSGCDRCADLCPTGALSMCAKEMTVSEIVDTVLRDQPFWGDSGGITLSGGEPLIHKECAEILKRIKDSGGTCCIETCGYVPEENILSVLPYTDRFYWDMKAGESKKHKLLTGVGTEKIISNLYLADENAAETVIRCIVVKGLNDELDSFKCIGDTVSRLKHCKGIELLKYHAMGGGKEKMLTGSDTTDKAYIPDDDEMKAIAQLLKERTGFEVKY